MVFCFENCSELKSKNTDWEKLSQNFCDVEKKLLIQTVNGQNFFETELLWCHLMEVFRTQSKC